ncbi:MAG TPA: gliding motility protein GldM [Flavobacteriales bacterium]|nr:gliding motility protein GldM [Flavobacteriales bacterium]HQW30992.1 gliding motility protein GldM [Flavobacteriales bacterium]HQY02610.1 gliding motility protein GldM [Flavobacteriales bacterium]HQY79309.1 gliding motility protein GldM [Flavobacteriales bacterium]HRA16298.1 gliding motility protein GldM [Flavobacteriales bacterium]
MAGGNLSPRQKMINLMYLVLTALLALNVSKEILDSFIIVNEGLENTKSTFKDKMDATYKQFSKLAAESPAKYGDAWKDAQQVQGLASKLVSHIDTLKGMLISKTDGVPLDQVMGMENGVDTVLNLEFVNSKDNNTHITEMMVGSEPAKPKEGPYTAKELRGMLESFRDKVKDAAKGDPKLQASADRMFNFGDRRDASGTMNNWSSMNFYHVPVVAGITTLSKIQTDIRTMESELVGRMMGAVEQESFKFNTLAAIIKPQSSYVTTGGTYRANIFLGAYDNQNAPEVYICGPGARVDTSVTPPVIVGEAIKLPMEGAQAILEQTATGAGLKTVTGIIKFKPVGGEEQIRRFTTEYEVAAPSLVVSPTKMNVFYRGVDNPVSISVAGYSATNISPNMTNGTLSKDKDGYIVRPGAGQDAVVGVTVTNPDGTKKTMPGVEFRVKNVPNPTPYFAGKGVNDNTVKSNELKAAQGVIAKLENFQFDLRFEVVSYTVSATIGGNLLEKECRGPALSSDAKTVLEKLRTNQKVYIENIKAKGPDGTVRNIGALSFKVI